MKQFNLTNTKELENTLKQNGYSLLTIKDNVSQFKSCQAWAMGCEILDESTGEVFQGELLQSYNTLVSVVFNGLLIRGKYSSTTSKQITQWSYKKHFDNTITYKGNY